MKFGVQHNLTPTNRFLQTKEYPPKNHSSPHKKFTKYVFSIKFIQNVQFHPTPPQKNEYPHQIYLFSNKYLFTQINQNGKNGLTDFSNNTPPNPPPHNIKKCYRSGQKNNLKMFQYFFKNSTFIELNTKAKHIFL